MKKFILTLLVIIMLLISAVLTAEKQKKAGEKQKVENRQEQTIKKSRGKYKGELADFYFKDADLQNVLLHFAKTYKFNLVLDPDISGKVTCRLVQVPWDQALAVILRQHGLAMLQDGNVVSIINLDKIK